MSSCNHCAVNVVTEGAVVNARGGLGGLHLVEVKGKVAELLYSFSVADDSRSVVKGKPRSVRISLRCERSDSEVCCRLLPLPSQTIHCRRGVGVGVGDLLSALLPTTVSRPCCAIVCGPS
jgi:hypothetical protein